MKLAAGTELGALLRDESKLEKVVIDALKASADPMAREIGEGLASGTMSWSTIATTSAYADFLDRNLAALRQFDFNGLVGELEAAQVEAAQKKAEEQQRRSYDDEDDVWQGLDGNGQ